MTTDATWDPSAGRAEDDAPQTRFCGYRACGQPLEYDGRGRPPEYCRDRRWPNGKTCRQQAALERTVEREGGLQAPLESFRSAGERLAAVAGPLAHQLAEVVSAVQQVQEGALSRIGDAEDTARSETERATRAEVAAAQAEQERAAAQADREQAQATVAQVEQQARAAVADARQHAEAGIAHAERQAEQARQEADEQVRRAWQQVAEADHARGRAEAAAAAAQAALAERAQERDAAQQRAAAAEEELRQLRDQREQDRSALAELRRQLTAAGERADAAQAELSRLRELTPRRGQPGGPRRLRRAGGRGGV